MAKAKIIVVKLSEKQKEVIRLMRDGYELGYSTGWGGSVWLQQGGCGRGGKSAKITFGTFIALGSRKLIKSNDEPYSRPVRYHLTELGKSIEL